jgi:hypothetical protein
MELLSLDCCNGKCQLYGIHLRYWSEGIIIVNSMHLLKDFGYKPGFESSNMSICYSLGPIDTSSMRSFLLEGRGTKSQVSFWRRELYSSCMVDSQKGFPTASP